MDGEPINMSFARVRALAIVGVLVICAAILVAVTLFKDKQQGSDTADACPSGSIISNLTLPVPKDVKITTFNAMGNATTVNSTSIELSNRQFQVTQSKESMTTVTEVAILRYGPNTVGAAWLVNAYFLDSAELEFDINRTDDTVDVIFGSNFRKLATSTEVSQALAQMGRPDEPAGTCGMDYATEESATAEVSSQAAESSPSA